MGHYREAAARIFTWLAALTLLFMMLFTVFAVIRREVFDHPLLGVVDVMELALVVCVLLAIPAVFLRNDHIVVDLVDNLVPNAVIRRLRGFALVLAIGFVAAMLVEMFPAAWETFHSGEVTMTLGIARYWHWLAIVSGFICSLLALLWLLVDHLRGNGRTNP